MINDCAECGQIQRGGVSEEVSQTPALALFAGEFALRNREETLFEGLPKLPDLAHRDGKALRKVEISVQQSDFWKGREE